MFFTILRILAEFSRPAQPPPQRPGAKGWGREEGGGRGRGVFRVGRPSGGAGRAEAAQEEHKGEGRPLSPSFPLKTSLVSITSD